MRDLKKRDPKKTAKIQKKNFKFFGPFSVVLITVDFESFNHFSSLFTCHYLLIISKSANSKSIGEVSDVGYAAKGKKKPRRKGTKKGIAIFGPLLLISLISLFG